MLFPLRSVRYFSRYFYVIWNFSKSPIIKKNVPWHILAPRAVTCDNLHLRASAHLWHVSAFLCNRNSRNFLLHKKDQVPSNTQSLIKSLFCLVIKVHHIRSAESGSPSSIHVFQMPSQHHCHVQWNTDSRPAPIYFRRELLYRLHRSAGLRQD